jgi:carbon-monoxide dehydrogenase medium subunit
MKPAPFGYTHAGSLQEAIRALGASDGDVKAISGGQSLGPMLNLRLARPGHIVGVGHLPEMKQVSDTASAIRIAAGVTHAAIEDGLTPEPIPGMLRHVAAGIAYRAVRNRGTIGGSLAHADPAADWVSAMTVLDARIETATAVGKGRTIAMVEFMSGAYRTVLDPGEVIVAVIIPKGSAQARWGYYKICRKVGEFAMAIGAIVVDPEKRYCRIVAGSTGGAPLVLDTLGPLVSRTARVPEVSQIGEALRCAGLRAGAVKTHQLATSVARAIAMVVEP